jgi:excisionase family DNA binding protein
MLRSALSTKEAAVYLDMSTSYLTKARTEGNIGNRTPGPPYHKVGRRVLYKIEDLDEWLNSFRVERAQ